jgi:plastocyanin
MLFMKKLAVFVLPLMLVSAMLVAGCGKTPGGTGTNPPSGPTDHIDMTVDNFTSSSITVKSGTEFSFVDPSDSGGLHIICTGDNGKCVADANAPSDLGGQGFTINPGETKKVTFDKPGTYHIACTVHPNMNLTITVQ